MICGSVLAPPRPPRARPVHTPLRSGLPSAIRGVIGAVVCAFCAARPAPTAAASATAIASVLMARSLIPVRIAKERLHRASVRHDQVFEEPVRIAASRLDAFDGDDLPRLDRAFRTKSLTQLPGAQ